MNKYRIYGNIASSKNSKVKTKWGVVDSAATKKCYKLIIPQLEEIRDDFKMECNHFPIKLHIFFHRYTKHKFDYINPCQTLQDALVKAGCLEDDNANIVIPVFEGYDITNLEHSGCEFWIE